MKVTAFSGDITKVEASAAVVNLFEGVQTPGGATGAMDRAMGGAIRQLIAEGEIKGRKGEITLIHSFGRVTPARVVVLGLGEQKEFSPEVIRNGMAEVCRRLRSIGTKRIATILHGAGIGGMDPQESAQVITEGALLGLYTFQKHKSQKENASEVEEFTIVEVEELMLVEVDKARIPQVERGIEAGRIVAEAANLARDMANEPSNFMTPTDMAQVARSVAERWSLEWSVLERDDMSKMGMGAILGVAQGSAQPPKLIVLRYWGDRGHSENTLGLVGKGVTFDSGGISIKPAEGMGEMKTDMSGGASVIAAMQAIAQLKPKINVIGVVPAAENLPSGTAQKPGDVLKAMNGKTIEVENTDAEGRLLLADAICYAKHLGAKKLVDVATLTGAIRIALGTVCSGAFGNDQALMERVIKAGAKTGERIWQLPMYEEYKEQNRSDVADVKNSGGRAAGSITAAQFIAEFSEGTPWVHLDIAATARSERQSGYTSKGATGVPVRTLVQLVQDLAAEK